MASCVKNIRTKNYQNQNLVFDFQVTVKNVGDVFFRDTVYSRLCLETNLGRAVNFCSTVG